MGCNSLAPFGQSNAANALLTPAFESASECHEEATFMRLKFST